MCKSSPALPIRLSSLYPVTISHSQTDLSQKGTLMTNSHSSPTTTTSSNSAPPNTPSPSSSTNSTSLNNQHHFANVSPPGNIQLTPIIPSSNVSPPRTIILSDEKKLTQLGNIATA